MPDTAHTTGFDQDAFYDSVLREKYCKHDERSREEIIRRVARGLAAVERAQAEAADDARRKLAAEGLGAAEATLAIATAARKAEREEDDEEEDEEEE